MIAYLDTSVFATLLLQDEGFERVETWLARGGDLFMSDLGWGEFVAALGARTRRAGASRSWFSETLAVGEEAFAMLQHVMIETADLRRATGFLLRPDRPLRLPDAIHIAVAERLDAALATNDHAQSAAALALGIATVNPLEEPA